MLSLFILSLYLFMKFFTHSGLVFEYSLKAQPIALFIKNSSLPKLLIIIFSNN